MGIKQGELNDGLTAAIDALDALLPGLRAAFEAFEPPRAAPPNPPHDAARQLLADAEALLVRIRDAHAGQRVGEEIAYPHALAADARALTEWCESVQMIVTRFRCRPISNVGTFAAAVIDLRQAHQLIRQRGWQGNLHLGNAWRTIGGLMWDRTDLLVVTGSILYSEGIRRRAQRALEASGATGGWKVYSEDGIRRAKFLLHEPHTWHAAGDDFKRNAPSGLYDDAVFDRESSRHVLPDELGHDTLPPLR